MKAPTEQPTDLIPLTLYRDEWRALLIAASITDTLTRDPYVLIPGGVESLDAARTTIAFVLRERRPIDVAQLRRNIVKKLDAPKPRTRRMSKKNRDEVSRRMRKYWAEKRQEMRRKK